MKKEKVLGYAIMESVAEPCKPQNIEVHDRNGQFYVKFLTTLQEFDKRNRNRRIYQGDAVMEGLGMDHISELIANKTWMGEAGHPMEDDTRRILTIDPKLVSHKINRFYRKENLLKGEIETLDDGNGFGSRMTKMILQGMEPAFSLRALAQLTDASDGTRIVKTRPHIVTYDWVILPSHNKAYRDKTEKVKLINKGLNDLGNDIVTESSVAVTEAGIIDFLNSDSKNIKLMSNICEIAKESMTLSNDLKHVIMKEDGASYYVNIEDRLRHDINRYLNRF